MSTLYVALGEIVYGIIGVWREICEILLLRFTYVITQSARSNYLALQ